MMRHYLWFLVAYFGYELLANGLLPTFEALMDFSTVETLDPWEGVTQNYIDMISLVVLMVLCRSRKRPLWFRVEIQFGDLDLQLINTGGDVAHQRQTVPLL